MIYLLIVGVFFGSWSVGACIGGPDKPVGIHESALAMWCAHDGVFDWNGDQFGHHVDCVLPAGDNDVCLVTTYNETYGHEYWICDDTRVPINISGYQSINVLVSEGNDDVIIRGSTQPLKGCSCTCNINSVYGAQVDWYDEGGNNVLGDLFSPVVRIYDMNWLGNGWDEENSGTDHFYGGANRTRVYDGNDGHDLFKSGPRGDLFEVWDESDTSKQFLWDLSGTDYWRTGSGNDTIWDDGCVVSSCNMGLGDADKTNCTAQCIGDEITGAIAEPTCPALPFP